jgi:FKBP-type peptidyl-prolyl cis-trans isomerase
MQVVGARPGGASPPPLFSCFHSAANTSAMLKTRPIALMVGLAAAAACSKKGSDAPAPRPADAGPVTPADLTTPPAEKTASGLATRLLHPGTGKEHPEPQDLVEVHYSGWSQDGKLFDSSRTRSAPAQFELASAIKGWAEGIALMVVGEQRRLWVPPALAYGDKPQAHAPSGPLVFDIELLRISKRPAPLPPPPDLERPPGDARKLPAGIVYRTLVKGTGTRHPRGADVVEVDYTSWRSTGKMLDSTVTRGQPSTFRADGLGKPFAEALAVMVVGEKARFWFPAALAGFAGPDPTIVYDIALRAIK